LGQENANIASCTETLRTKKMTLREKRLQNTDSINSPIERPTSTNLLTREVILDRLAGSQDARSRFIESNLSKYLAYQIRAMREQKDWNQMDLGGRVGMNQNAISRLENPFYGKHTLTTLKRLAKAFDVALVVRFAPFTELADWISGAPRLVDGLNQEALNVPEYARDIEQASSVPNERIPLKYPEAIPKQEQSAPRKVLHIDTRAPEPVKQTQQLPLPLSNSLVIGRPQLVDKPEKDVRIQSLLANNIPNISTDNLAMAGGLKP
jgi:transcriptional regulator with XRE-family HTH domain